MPVHRAVDLRLELVVPRPTVRRIDLAIGASRPIVGDPDVVEAYGFTRVAAKLRASRADQEE